MAKKNTDSPRSTPGTPRSTARRSVGVRAPSAADELKGGLDPSHDEIAKAAYHRYLGRGAAHGFDFDDWIEAERELRRRQ